MQAYMGGIVPTSFPNWKKNSCLAIFFAGCNFKCPYCNSPLLLDFKEEYLHDILELKRQINAFANTVDSVIFTGGEPTLQRQALLNLARHCKQIGLKVGLLTNGSKPDTILSLLREDILDYIEVDIKAPEREDIFESVTQSQTFFKPTKEIINDLKETLNLLKKNKKKIQTFFTTTIVPGLSDNPQFLEKIARLIKEFDTTWLLKGFDPEDVHHKVMRELEGVKEEELILLKDKLQKKYPIISIEISD
ncbi:radical SAM protein [Candidatus Woesearchaeota archaeon]|nr:radical SAM protein [Candidatus Woesearchaeota archaeon]